MALAALLGCPASDGSAEPAGGSGPSLHFVETNGGLLTLTEAGRDAGWTPLFNGADLTGWEPAGGTTAADYVVSDGELRFPKKGNDGYIRTATDHRDFELRLDFRIGSMCNSGLFLRGDRAGGNPAYSGCEIQILDDFDWEEVTGSTLRPYQFTGGLYGSVPPGVKALRPLGEWNRYEVSYVGSRIAVKLNGELLYDVDTHAVDATPPFAERAETGFIGLQRHAPAQVKDDVYASFRNVFVRDVAP